MSALNPNALNLWVMAVAIGYVCDGFRGGAGGLAIAATITMIIGILSRG